MVNMKLLDLQIGKYLEIGNDWVYGDEYIGILNTAIACGVKVDYQFSIQPHTNPIINQVAEKVGAVIYGGRYVLLQFANNKTVGDVIKHNPKRTQFDQLPKIYHTNEEVYEILSKDVVLCEEMGYSSEYVDPDYHFKIIGNIFEEYSKKEQGLENKFDELYDLIYGKK